MVEVHKRLNKRIISPTTFIKCNAFQVRAQYLKTLGGSDWGSELSDDVTMTDTFSMGSVYTVEKVVALFNSNIYTREIQGFLNRLNFSTLNYENLRNHNAKNYLQLDQVLPRMHKVTPIGGYNNSGKLNFKMKLTQWENLGNNLLGWILTLLPVVCLISAATSRSLLIQFTSCYCLFTLLCLSIIMLFVDFKNKQIFLDCKLCVPVPVNSESLKGLRNFFKDLTEENLRNLKSVKKHDRDLLIEILQNEKSALGTQCGKQNRTRTNRVMFYSVEYYQKFIQVPRYKLYGVCFLNAIFMCICIILSIRKLKVIEYW